MKQFLRRISFYCFLVLLLLCVLDIFYTEIYKKSVPRNKVQYALSLQNKNFDYIFLGSSRVENTIATSEIIKATNKKVLNLGTQQVKLKDILLFLKLLINNNVTAEKLFIQVDYNYNILVGSDIIRSQTLPYIRSNSFIKNYLKENDSSFISNYYIPFYRYAVNDYKIGFREIFSSVIRKKSAIDFQDGYSPLYGKMQPDEISILPQKLLKNNPTFEEITEICKINNINVVFFCAPFCEIVQGRQYIVDLKERIPELYDFSNVLTDSKYYENCNHLNNAGAIKFTQLLINEFKL